MHPRHPLQLFLNRHRVSQSELARAIGVTRETVNRWIRRNTVPAGTNLLRTLAFAKRFESTIDAQDLFSNRSKPADERSIEQLIGERWGHHCALCEVPWDLQSEHLPLAMLVPDLGSHPAGDICESCARKVAAESNDEAGTNGPISS
ncbi:MAG: helix-turn-helix transcriptional regulator [Thermoanaerobaculia bacterium]